MSRSTISTFKLFEMFPDEESARVYLEGRLWPNGTACPTCKATDRITPRKDGFYRCNACQIDFTVRTGTVFERSHVPLHKWVYAMYLLVTSRKGISSLQLAKEIGVTQKTAWFVLGRLREACGTELDKLRGTVEIDETYIGGKEGNKHRRRRLNAGRGAVGKTPVLGMRERDGRTIATVVSTVDLPTVQNEIHGRIEAGSEIHTAVFSDIINQDHGPDLADLLWASRIDTEWWKRSAPRGEGNGRRARCVVDNLMREDHPFSEEWLMVRRGDWPVSFVLAKRLGVQL